MTERITVKDLRPLVERMNRATGRPEGEADWTREEPCQLCGGSGRRSTSASTSGDALARHERNPEECPRCYGQGWRLTASVGRYTLDGAYGGWTVHRIMNIGGGVETPITYGHVPARELYGLIHAWLSGLEVGSDA